MKKEMLYVQNLSASDDCFLQGVSFLVFQGELLGIVGAHASGTTSLSNILQGQRRFDHGKIFVEGKRMDISTTSRANRAGIYRIDRKALIVDCFSVAENICLTYPSVLSGVLAGKREINDTAQRILDAYGVKMDIHEKAYTLDEYEKDVICIIKVMMRKAKVLILNDLMLHYSKQQRRRMHKLLSMLAASGVSAIITGTDVKTTADIADRILVFRNGRIEGQFFKGEYDVDLIDMLMSARTSQSPKIELPVQKDTAGGVRLKLENISAEGRVFPDAEICGGEIVSFIDRHGRPDRTIIDILIGRTPYSGEIWLDGRAISIRNARNSLDNGIAYLPMYNAPGTLHNSLSIADNLLLVNPRNYAHFGLINRRMQRFASRQLLKQTDIPYNVRNYPPTVLSAHQRNELNLLRMSTLKPKVILLDDPFVYADTSMKAQIYRFLQDMLEGGACAIANILTDDDRANLTIRCLEVC